MQFLWSLHSSQFGRTNRWSTPPMNRSSPQTLRRLRSLTAKPRLPNRPLQPSRISQAQSDSSTPSVEGAADENQTTAKGKDEKNESEPAAKSDKLEAATPDEKADKWLNSKKKTDAADAKKDRAVGEPLAPGMIKLIQDEIVAGLKKRGITDRFARFQSYAIGKVNSSAGRYTGSELTGNCRLTWYDHLMRNLLAAPAEAEQFTRELHKAASDSRDGLAQVLAIAAAKMDAGERKPHKPRRRNIARARVGSDQAGVDPGPGLLLRRVGPVEQGRDSAAADVLGSRVVHAELRWATR